MIYRGSHHVRWIWRCKKKETNKNNNAEESLGGEGNRPNRVYPIEFSTSLLVLVGAINQPETHPSPKYPTINVREQAENICLLFIFIALFQDMPYWKNLPGVGFIPSLLSSTWRIISCSVDHNSNVMMIGRTEIKETPYNMLCYKYKKNIVRHDSSRGGPAHLLETKLSRSFRREKWGTITQNTWVIGYPLFFLFPLYAVFGPLTGPGRPSSSSCGMWIVSSSSIVVV